MSARSDLHSLRSALQARARLLGGLRAFFAERDYLEVETPVRVATPALELNIDAEPAGDGFLRTSPELHMKRLLAAGYPRIYQVGPCFRRGESGARHHPEFSMLEWYCAGADYRQVLEDTLALLKHAADAVLGRRTFVFDGETVDLDRACVQWSVRDAFVRLAGWDPFVRFDADRFDVDLVEKVEPALPRDGPVALVDFPPELAALARCRGGETPVAERWELYLAGMELANAFGELTDPEEQRQRFKLWGAARHASGRTVYALDEAFLNALSEGMPASAGVALGVDRLLMLLTDTDDIARVRAFCE